MRYAKKARADDKAVSNLPNFNPVGSGMVIRFSNDGSELFLGAGKRAIRRDVNQDCYYCCLPINPIPGLKNILEID